MLALTEDSVATPGLTRLTFSDREKGEQALVEAIRLQLPIESYQSVHGSLEDLFIQLVRFDEGGGRSI